MTSSEPDRRATPESSPQPARALLQAVLDRIIPADAYPSATQSGVDGFILDLWSRGLVSEAPAIRAGLEALDVHAIRTGVPGFRALSEAEQDRLIATIAAEPWFLSLCERAAEGYYADPGNGANPDAVSWTMMGYRPGLPEGADGPPWSPADAQPGKLWA